VLTVMASPTTKPGTYPITILGNLGSSTRTITLSLVVPQSSVRLSTGSLTFPGQKVGTTSSAQTVTFTNYGSTAMSIGGITTTGNFSQTNNCGTSVASKASCTITVKFTPRAVGALNGMLTIKDSDGSSPQKVPLSGTGLAAAKINIQPLSLYFSGHTVGTTSTLPLTLKNSGTSTLTFSQMTIVGANAADFKYTSGCGTTLAVGASCTVSVKFTPSVKGSRTAALSIYDNDGYQNSPQAVSLTGTGK